MRRQTFHQKRISKALLTCGNTQYKIYFFRTTTTIQQKVPILPESRFTRGTTTEALIILFPAAIRMEIQIQITEIPIVITIIIIVTRIITIEQIPTITVLVVINPFMTKKRCKIITKSN